MGKQLQLHWQKHMAHLEQSIWAMYAATIKQIPQEQMVKWLIAKYGLGTMKCNSIVGSLLPTLTPAQHQDTFEGYLEQVQKCN